MITARTLKFTAGTTNTITGAFNVRGNFGVLMNVISTGTSAATLSANIGTINSKFIALTWITATGGSTWNAIDSSDNGNNTGWNFIISKILQVYVVDTWKTVKNMKIRVNGVWKQVIKSKIQISGVWKNIL